MISDDNKPKEVAGDNPQAGGLINLPRSQNRLTRRLTTLKRPRSQPVTGKALPPSVKNKIRAISSMMDTTQIEITEPPGENTKPRTPLATRKITERIPRIPKKPAIILIALILLVIGFRQFTTFRLATYQHDEFTISAPKGFTTEASGSLITLMPKKSGSDYLIVVLLPEQQGLNFDLSQASDSINQSLLELVETTLERTVQQYTPKGQQLGTTTLTLTTHQDKDAVKINGELMKDGKKSGQIVGLSVFDEQGIYTAIVVTSIENSKVEQNTNNLINSFKLR